MKVKVLARPKVGGWCSEEEREEVVVVMMIFLFGGIGPAQQWYGNKNWGLWRASEILGMWVMLKLLSTPCKTKT